MIFADRILLKGKVFSLTQIDAIVVRLEMTCGSHQASGKNLQGHKIKHHY